MKIDISLYEKKYYGKDGFNGPIIDNWQEGIKISPLENHTNRSGFDKNCSMQGTTGELFRLLENDNSAEIVNFEESVEYPVREYLSHQSKLTEEKINELINIIRDILYVDGNLNITEISFLKYLPRVPHNDDISDKLIKKYDAGQRKIGAYLFSALSGIIHKMPQFPKSNLFSKILGESLDLKRFDTSHKESNNSEYYMLPFVKDSFQQDFLWMMNQDEAYILKNIHLLLHFYVCYAVVQSYSHLSASKVHPATTPIRFYFILNEEKVSVNHDAITRGWDHFLPKHTIDKFYGKAQAMDIVNTVLGGGIGFYPQLLEKLQETPFEENLPVIKQLLELYKSKKLAQLEKRDSEEKRGRKQKIEAIDDKEITSYEDFFIALENLCTSLQSSSYTSRLRGQMVELLSVRFLQRRRGIYVLTLDKEMLIFLVSLLTRNKRIKLEELYKRFNNYGINFNRGSRIKIEEYLLKLNLLIRKSDSGESQYVYTVL